MARRTQLRTAALAVLVVLGLLLTGSARATSPMQSDAVAAASGDKIVATVSHPVLPLAQTTRLLPVMKTLAEKAHPEGATLASGASVLDARLILLLLFPPGERALGLAGHRSNASRAPPVAS
jgi:hypothetical protein